MNHSTTTVQPKTEVIEKHEWISFLDRFTREHRGAHARLEVLGEEGYEVELENRPLDGVSADLKDGEHSILITFGATPANHLTHGVIDATVLRYLPPIGDAAAVLEIEENDGDITLLELGSPEAYELPPGASANRRK